jgi:hypothetical protein
MATTPRAAKESAESAALLDVIESGIVDEGRSTPWSYVELAACLGRSSRHGAYLGQCVSRIDAACFEAGLPALSMKWIVTSAGKPSPKTCEGSLWRGVADDLARSARCHTWTPEDLHRIRSALLALPEGSARSIWARIEATGDEAVKRALSHV